MASGLLKRAVGGPKRWAGLPYRGPLSPSTTPSMAEALLTLSDGEGACLMTLDSSSRAVGSEYVYPEQRNDRPLTLHVP